MLISDPVMNAGLTLTEYTSAPQAPPVASLTENASDDVGISTKSARTQSL